MMEGVAGLIRNNLETYLIYINLQQSATKMKKKKTQPQILQTPDTVSALKEILRLSGDTKFSDKVPNISSAQLLEEAEAVQEAGLLEAAVIMEH